MNSGRFRTAMLWVMLSTTLLIGCTPIQPHYLHEDGDLSHYIDTAKEIDFPDYEQPFLDEVSKSLNPLTIRTIDTENLQTLEMTLEEAISIALHNSKVIRTFGQIRQFGQFVSGPAERLSAGIDSAGTIYDVAIQESGQGGVEQVLSNFDAVFNSTTTWESFDRLQNVAVGGNVNTPLNQQDVVDIVNEISKQTASGAQIFVRNTNRYNGVNDIDTFGIRATSSDWFTTLETEIRQPLLRNRGTQVNRIPVVLARIRTDVTLANFETQVMGLLSEVERAYWELFFFYHNFKAAKTGMESALGIWRRVHAKYESGASGGEAEQEAQAREQFYTFNARMKSELNNVLKVETRLRFLLGWGPSDGRLIRPITEATTADLKFDWCIAREEALLRSPVLRQQRWQIKRRELELIAARNQLLPRFDAIGLYRWNGAGSQFNSTNPPDQFGFPGGAVQDLLGGDHQEFRLGAELEVPIGFRREMAQVRNQQLLLAREKARLEDMELEIVHQLDDSFKELDAQYVLTQENLNRLSAAQKQVEAVEAAFDAGTVVLDLLLDAQRRRADAEVAMYQALINYQLAMVTVHFRKGSILDYNSVVLSEGPWPAKAYFDAQNAARQRDASYPLNYGFSRPNVISRGPLEKNSPQPADPVAYTGDPYPIAAHDAGQSRDEDDADEATDGRQQTEDEQFRFDMPGTESDDGVGEGVDESDQDTDDLLPPPLEDEYEFQPGPDTAPPLEDRQLEAHRRTSTAARAISPARGDNGADGKKPWKIGETSNVIQTSATGRARRKSRVELRFKD